LTPQWSKPWPLVTSGGWQSLNTEIHYSFFLKRDHGALLQIVGRPRKALQYPDTASKMTRHRLSAGLYAPLCVILYEDENGDTVFEYDKPSPLFGQFDDDAVTAVARGLDDALEGAIRRAME
jgi:hypothetical protein